MRDHNDHFSDFNKEILDFNILKDIGLFSDLSAEELEAISKGVLRRFYSKGDFIFQSGYPADKLYIIYSGKMKIFKYLLDGREQLLYVYAPGDFVGGFNLLKKTEYIYNALALQDSVIYTLSKESFNEIAVKNPSILLKILEKAFERVRWAEGLVDRLIANSTDARVAILLLDLIPKFGINLKKGIQLNLSINREEMGSYAGLTRETMTRKLNQFKKAGLIDFSGNKTIVLKNLEELRLIAQNN